MPALRELADGKLLARPLLDIPRRQLLDHARRHALQWIEDESNDDPRFSRNFLRGEVLPSLECHYPAYRQALGRAARHAAEAAGLLDDLAAQDLARESPGDTLDIERLRRLDGPRGRNALRYFLAQNGIGHPPCEELEEIRRQLLDASPDKALSFVLDGRRLQRYRGVAAVVADALPFRGEWFFCWNGEERLSLAGGWLHFASCRGEGLSRGVLLGARLCLKPRRGGEGLRTHAGGPHRSLKHLYQEHGVPPWQRLSTPILWWAEHLLWVPGVGANADFMARPGEDGVCLRWISG